MSEIKRTSEPMTFEVSGQHFRSTSRATVENSPFLRASKKSKADKAALLSALQQLVEALDWGTSAEYRALQEHQVMRTARTAIAETIGVQS